MFNATFVTQATKIIRNSLISWNKNWNRKARTVEEKTKGGVRLLLNFYAASRISAAGHVSVPESANGTKGRVSLSFVSFSSAMVTQQQNLDSSPAL